MTLYVYILECRDGSYYTGITNDVWRRVSQHNEEVDPKAYAFRRRPVQLVFTGECGDAKQAILTEKRIKGWSHGKKRALIAGDWRTIQELAECRNVLTT